MPDTKKSENQLDYVELPATDIGRTKQFYTAVFGWKFEDYGPDYTCFFDGRLGGGFTKERPAPVQGLLLVICSSDLAAAQKKIRDAGGSIAKDTFSFPGGRKFHFTDPAEMSSRCGRTRSNCQIAEVRICSPLPDGRGSVRGVHH